MNKKLAEQRRDAIVAVVVLVVVILVVGGVGILFLGDKIEFVEGEAEAHEFRVSSKVPGRILKFYVEEG
ncbi:MAG: HlyD family secretion protein, partial [Bacteroidaceae bacterium]|nr:HlyD family secretion protein [Bacteroidaceae bacterium]